MITVGQQLPNATINEYLEVATEGCAIGPNAFEVNKLTAGKKIVIFWFARSIHSNLFSKTRTWLCDSRS